MKELKEFTVERLSEIAMDAYEANPTNYEMRALAKIALAAKQAQIVAWEVKGIFCHTKEEASIYVGDPEPLYDAPPLNHTEPHMVAPDGWRLVPIEPTESMVISGFESEPDKFFSSDEEWKAYKKMSGCQQAARRAELCYAAMIGAAPKPEM